jgi:hypothetical protein
MDLFCCHILHTVDMYSRVERVEALLKKQQFGVDETKKIVYDLTFGEHSKSDEAAKVEFIVQKMTEHQKRCNEEFPGNEGGEDGLHGDSSGEDDDEEIGPDESASKLGGAPVAEQVGLQGAGSMRSPSPLPVSASNNGGSVLPSVCGHFVAEQRATQPGIPVANGRTFQSTTNVVDAPPPRYGGNGDDWIDQIRRLQEIGYTPDVAFSFVSKANEKTMQQWTTAAKDLSKDQFDSLLRWDIAKQNPNLAGQYLKPALLSNKSASVCTAGPHSKRKFVPTCLAYAKLNMQRVSGKSTPIVVQALQVTDESPLLFAIDQLTSRLCQEPLLRRYGIQQLGYLTTLEEGGPMKLAYSSVGLSKYDLQHLMNLARENSDATSLTWDPKPHGPQEGGCPGVEVVGKRPI